MRKITKALIAITLISSLTVPLYLDYLVRNTGLGSGSATVPCKESFSIAASICAECSSDEEKAHAIHDWIALNIEYDDDYDAMYQFYDEKRLLETRIGLCFDYANLYASMCRSQNIPCYIVDGYKRTDPSALHTRNRVFFNGTWWNVDVTYDSAAGRYGKRLYGFLNIGTASNCPDEDYVITRIY